MTVLEQILDRDHSPGMSAYMLEIPASKEFLPCIVSNTKNNFLVSNRLTSDLKLRCGFFNVPNSGLDVLLPLLMQTAYDLSVKQLWGNRFKSISKAHGYVSEASSLAGQPHCLLFPDSWGEDSLFELCDDGDLTRADGDIISLPWLYKSFTRVIFCPVQFAVFLSRPDYVGLLHTSGDFAAIVLHNVEFGMSFLTR